METPTAKKNNKNTKQIQFSGSVTADPFFMYAIL